MLILNAKSSHWNLPLTDDNTEKFLYEFLNSYPWYYRYMVFLMDLAAILCHHSFFPIDKKHEKNRSVCSLEYFSYMNVKCVRKIILWFHFMQLFHIKWKRYENYIYGKKKRKKSIEWNVFGMSVSEHHILSRPISPFIYHIFKHDIVFAFLWSKNTWYAWRDGRSTMYVQ